MEAVRTSLEVGFPEGVLPEALGPLRGKTWRAIAATEAFPFEDAQFEVVLMDGAAVTRAAVKEANRVLKPDGRLVFTVPEKTRAQAGFTLPEIYATVREGFNIVDVRRPAWWFFRRSGRTFTITAKKKAWKNYKGFVRDGSLPFTPFRSRT